MKSFQGKAQEVRIGTWVIAGIFVAKRSGSWLGLIKEHRRRCLKILFDSPSLRNHLIAVLNECYEDAKDLAATETELPMDVFPADCPFSIDEILNSNFLPADSHLD